MLAFKGRGAYTYRMDDKRSTYACPECRSTDLVYYTEDDGAAVVDKPWACNDCGEESFGSVFPTVRTQIAELEQELEKIEQHLATLRSLLEDDDER